MSSVEAVVESQIVTVSQETQTIVVDPVTLETIVVESPAGGQLAHGIFTAGVPTLAASGTIRNNLVNGAGSVATGYASAAGAALTGGTVGPVPLLGADFSNTATAQATTGTVGAAGFLHGLICLPPGTGWAPLHPGAGTLHLSSYSITWEEVPW